MAEMQCAPSTGFLLQSAVSIIILFFKLLSIIAPFFSFFTTSAASDKQNDVAHSCRLFLTEVVSAGRHSDQKSSLISPLINPQGGKNG
ncbi:hypothetical protein [Desulfonema ishimotonii]|uniref:hypothetical protein n=1 Tax=Desulfonema ishimotonii TaxID=45657 RepID=UPI000F5738ED|nr:hypothetical protein [Desulfonema ishimotonii]